MMPPKSNPRFDKLIRPKPPVIVVTAYWGHEAELIGLADSDEAAAQLIENFRKLPEYAGASFETIARVLWSKQKDE